MSDLLVSRRECGLLAAALGASLFTGGCVAAAGGAVSGGGSGAAAAIVSFARTIGLGIVANELTKVVDALSTQVIAFYTRNGITPPVDVQADSSVYSGRPSPSTGPVYAVAMSITEANTMAPVQPQPILFAANGEFMNLVPRAVRAISATKTGLTALGVADADVPYWTLPLNGSLSGTKFDVSYKTAGGRLEVSYNSRTNKESVTIMGLPARPSVTWSYDVSTLA